VWVLRAYVWYISMFSSTLTATVVYTLYVVVLYAHVCPESLQPFNVLNSNKQPLENVWKNKKTFYNNTLDEQAVYIRKVKITRTATECVLFWKKRDFKTAILRKDILNNYFCVILLVSNFKMFLRLPICIGLCNIKQCYQIHNNKVSVRI
jgi:hypothetical protein